jgi:hypothetical protein
MGLFGSGKPRTAHAGRPFGHEIAHHYHRSWCKLVLVRHGQMDYNVKHLLPSQLPGIPLNEEGRREAQATATTATPKPEPSVVPLTDMAFCQHIMSLAEANQIMSPPAPATTIIPNNTSNGGSCNYTRSSQPPPADFVVAISLLPWTWPTPISQQDIETALEQDESKAGASGITITTFAMVSGVGDQAAFLAASGSYKGLTFKSAAFYVLYGKIFFDCFNPIVGSSPDATQQSDLQQCAQQVVSRL